MVPIALVLALQLASPSGPALRGPPARIGECRWVRGRYMVYNGSSVRRIWPIGTRRIVALYDYDAGVPPEIDRYTDDFMTYRGVKDALYGDFHVCAREPSRPGHMQHVRLVATRKLIFRGRRFQPRLPP